MPALQPLTATLHAAPQPQQGEMPFAIVQGEPVTELPHDLYIPPDALRVLLEAFEGPLDLLLYLIKRQNLDILDIPIAEITRQYTQYIELMQGLRFELAAEYLLMAAMLAEIKSRMLLPRPVDAEGREEDPRAELVRRLQEYERYKRAAEDIETLPRQERDFFRAQADTPDLAHSRPPPDVPLRELLLALHEVMARADLSGHHHVKREALSVRERMSQVLAMLKDASGFTEFARLFDTAEGKMGVVVTFLALLELIRESLVVLQQAEAYAPIHVRAAVARDVPETPRYD